MAGIAMHISLNKICRFLVCVAYSRKAEFEHGALESISKEGT